MRFLQPQLRLQALQIILLMGLAASADAQRTSENAVRSADDAFGTSIGNEDVGLYNGFDVRGFSPTRAGNIRIDGLYYDQVFAITSRLRQSTAIRIGISAQGFPFPAPTGVVDYALRKPGDSRSLSAVTSIDTYGAGIVELDGVIPIVPGLSAGLGIGLYANEFENGTDSLQHIEGVSLRWTPNASIEVMPFWSRSDIYDDEIGPVYVPAGTFLPPRPRARRYLGPQWAEYEGVASTYGAISRFTLAPSWQLRVGAFHSYFENTNDHFVLLSNLNQSGLGNYLVFADPPSKLKSSSGEARLTRQFVADTHSHQLHLSLRGRERRNRYDGGDLIDLGPNRINQPINAPEPVRSFGPQTRDAVSQQTLGLAYEGRWKEFGELSVGVQKTDYEKRTLQPGLAPSTTTADPWLFNIASAYYATPNVAFYGGYTRGLEESGVAPPNASNRNQALPAILTNQRDLGLRWSINPNIKLIAGLFDVRKPYFNLDANNRFALLGDVENKGVEMSLSGAINDRLHVVAGAVLSHPRVTGEGVRLGRLGRLPVDQASRRGELNVDWRPLWQDGLSLDLTVSHTGRIVATRDNQVSIPAHTLLNLGARYAFRLHERPASLRFAMSNVFDTFGWELKGAGAFDVMDGRRATLRLVVDF
jgi:iron complex outermembrane recepter protein